MKARSSATAVCLYRWRLPFVAHYYGSVLPAAAAGSSNALMTGLVAGVKSLRLFCTVYFYFPCSSYCWCISIFLLGLYFITLIYSIFPNKSH